MTRQVLAVTAQAIPAQPFATHMIDGCVRERDRDREREREGGRGRERERVRVCVCV